MRLKLKLQYFGYLMQRTDSLEMTLRRRGQQRMRWLDGITDSMHPALAGWFFTTAPLGSPTTPGHLP